MPVFSTLIYSACSAGMWATLNDASDHELSPPLHPPTPAIPPPAKPPRKSAATSAVEVHVWPPTPSKSRPKYVALCRLFSLLTHPFRDKCARIWSARNPDGTEDEFNAFYKEKIPSQHLRNVRLPPPCLHPPDAALLQKYIQFDGDMDAAPSRNRKPRGNVVKGVSRSFPLRMVPVSHNIFPQTT